MGNVHMEATQINYRGGSKKMSVEEAIKAAGTEITPEEKTWIDSIPALTTSNAGKTDQDVIAPEFDAEAGVYAVGDKVMYEGKLYEFTSAHETPGDWDSTEVSDTTVADELSSLESGLMNVVKDITSTVTLSTGVSSAMVIKAGNMVFISAIATVGAGDDLITDLPTCSIKSIMGNVKIYGTSTTLIADSALNNDAVFLAYATS